MLIETIKKGNRHSANNRHLCAGLFTDTGIKKMALVGPYPDADCVFVTRKWSSITAIVDTLAEQIGKPIISSSSATLYGILKKLGIQDSVPPYGQALVRPRK